MRLVMTIMIYNCIIKSLLDSEKSDNTYVSKLSERYAKNTINDTIITTITKLYTLIIAYVSCQYVYCVITRVYQLIGQQCINTIVIFFFLKIIR